MQALSIRLSTGHSHESCLPSPTMSLLIRAIEAKGFVFFPTLSKPGKEGRGKGELVCGERGEGVR